MAIRHFSEIKAWQEASILTREVYRLTGLPGRRRDFAITDQLRRAAVSMMSNIAEGFARHTHADFARFLDMARASGAEADSLLFVCGDIGLLNDAEVGSLRVHLENAVSFIAKFQEHLRNPGVREEAEEYSA